MRSFSLNRYRCASGVASLKCQDRAIDLGWLWLWLWLWLVLAASLIC
ncbi:hypothetical protein SMJ63A_60229 [Stenotrophomonas geniculata]